MTLPTPEQMLEMLADADNRHELAEVITVQVAEKVRQELTEQEVK